MQIESSTTSIDAIEEREKMLEHRAKILDAELSRLSGEPTYTVEHIRNRLKEKYSNVVEIQG